MKQATFKLATLSAAIALSLSIAGCKEKKLEAVPADQVGMKTNTAQTQAEVSTSTEQLETISARLKAVEVIEQRLSTIEKQAAEAQLAQEQAKGKAKGNDKSVKDELTELGVFDKLNRVEKLLSGKDTKHSPDSDETDYTQYGVAPSVPVTIGGGERSKPNLVKPTINDVGEQYTLPRAPSTIAGARTVPSGDWIMPIDAVMPLDPKKGSVSYAFDSKSIEYKNFGTGPTFQTADSKTETPAAKPELIKYGTIAQESTLLDSVTMTALIGRIPVKGTLVDPFEFKVLIGKENLAANGLYVPNLEKMIMRGVAKGHYTETCVSGDIVAATYVFTDGTIQTINASDIKTGNGGYNSSGQVTQERLGWLSTPGGTPCVPGKYFSDAPELIAAQGGLAALGAFAAGLAESAKVTEGTGDSKTTSVNDSGKYALGQGGVGAVNTLTEWINDIKESAYGIVFVESNQKVAIHITKEIPIDYNPEGRKLTYQEYTNEKTQLD